MEELKMKISVFLTNNNYYLEEGVYKETRRSFYFSTFCDGKYRYEKKTNTLYSLKTKESFEVEFMFISS